MKTRLYHIVAIHEKSGLKEYLTSYPMTFDEGCRMMAQFSYDPTRRIQLEEAKPIQLEEA